MNFIKLQETSNFKKNNKNIAILTNDFDDNAKEYEDIFILKLFGKSDENLMPLEYLGDTFLDSLNFFIIDEDNLNYFINNISDFPFELIVFHHNIFDSNFFDSNLLNLIVKAFKSNNIKMFFDIGNNSKLIDLLYDDSMDYLFRTLIQNVDLIITSNNSLKSKLIDFNDYIIVMPQLLNSESNHQIFSNFFKKWVVLLKSFFNNPLTLDVIIEYFTELAEYEVIHNSTDNDYKISVIIPIHNTGEKLRRTLRSIEYQTLGIEYIEVLMVNDCSDDSITLNILNEYVQKNNFKLINLKENQGRPGIPRNIGIKESSAEYIMFLDHDDFFEINGLARLYNEMIDNEYDDLDLVFGTYASVEDENAVIPYNNNDKNGYVHDLTESLRLLSFPAPSIWTKLFKKELIVKNNILFPHVLGEDAIFVDKVLLNAKGIKYLQKTLIAFHDLGKTSITNHVTLRYLREGILAEQYLKDYFENNNVSSYFKYRVDVLANFFLKKLINQSKLTEKEIRLLFPKYLWAMNQVKEYGSDLLFNKEIYETILSYDVEKIIKLILPNSCKKNILYVTVLDENKSFPLIDLLDELLNNVNVYAVTYTDFKIKLWSCNLDNFRIINEIKFHDRVPNFYQLNKFYEDIFEKFSIDKVFFRHFDSNDYMFYFRSMIQTQRITPLSFASDRNIVTIYGESSKYLLDNLDFDYLEDNNLNPTHEKGVVYTAIFGNYEPLLDPKVIDENLDYICFTDNPNVKSDFWKIKLIPDFVDDFHFIDYHNNEVSFIDLDHTRQARAIKSLPHLFLKEYDFSIWVDAGFLIVGDVIQFVNRYTEKDFLGITHSTRKCLYDEANEVLRLDMDDTELISNQIARYKDANFPEKNGLIESGVLFRRHNNPKIIKVMEDWFSEIVNFSKRDQISFNYVAWKNNLDFDLAKMYCTRNPYFHHYFHRIKSTINNKVTLNDFRVILLDNHNLDDLKKSIDEVDKINDYIPISIITNNKNLRKLLDADDYNLEIVYLENDISSELISNIVLKKSEKFIHVMGAGEFLEYDYILRNI